MKWHVSDRLLPGLCGLILTALTTTASAARPLPPAADGTAPRTGALAVNPVSRPGFSVSRLENPVSRPENPDTLAGASSPSSEEADTTSRYARRVERYRHRWQRLIPNHHVIQYAGSIGLVSFGTGWHYGHDDDWETELLLGIVPRYHADRTKVSFTVRQRYIPWHLPLSSRWTIEPLTAGLFVNSIFGEGFWTREPSRYSNGYYGFATKIRANIFLGQRLKFNIPRRHRISNKSISVFYELSTSDLYLITAVTNRAIRLSDILSLAVGVKFETF